MGILDIILVCCILALFCLVFRLMVLKYMISSLDETRCSQCPTNKNNPLKKAVDKRYVAMVEQGELSRVRCETRYLDDTIDWVNKIQHAYQFDNIDVPIHILNHPDFIPTPGFANIPTPRMVAKIADLVAVPTYMHVYLKIIDFDTMETVWCREVHSTLTGPDF